jgi:hypothetical protein
MKRSALRKQRERTVASYAIGQSQAWCPGCRTDAGKAFRTLNI